MTHEELESSVLAVLERHGPQPKHALAGHLSDEHPFQVENAELRAALLSLERSHRIAWDGGVVSLPGRVEVVRPDDDEQYWREETFVDDDRVEGPDVPLPDGDGDNDIAAGPGEPVWYLVATEYREVRATSPQKAADEVLADSDKGTAIAIERDLVDVYERALVTRRVNR